MYVYIYILLIFISIVHTLGHMFNRLCLHQSTLMVMCIFICTCMCIRECMCRHVCRCMDGFTCYLASERVERVAIIMIFHFHLQGLFFMHVSMHAGICSPSTCIHTHTHIDRYIQKNCMHVQTRVCMHTYKEQPP